VTGEATGLTVVMVSRVLAIYYYAYFLVVLPVLGLRETPSRVPDTISTPVLSGHGAVAHAVGAQVTPASDRPA
jgi:hypothetical protein